jgi:hypothetical protein
VRIGRISGHDNGMDVMNDTIKIQSIDKQCHFCFQIDPGADCNDGTYFKYALLSIVLESENIRSHYTGEGKLKPVERDELMAFIADLNNLDEQLNGRASLVLEFIGGSWANSEFYRLHLEFYTLDTLGHIGVKIQVERDNRYSETKTFIHGSSLEFAVYSETLEAFAKYIGDAYSNSSINNEKFS